MPTWTPTAWRRKRTPNQRATQVTTRIRPARSMIRFGAAAPAKNAPTPSGRRCDSLACRRETSSRPPAATGRPTTIVTFAQTGTGRKKAEPAPTSTKAIISSRCAQSRLPPAREKPGQRGPAVTLSTATFEASPSRPGRTVSRNEPTELAVYMARKPISGWRTVEVQASARSGCTAAQIASPASRKRQSGVAAARMAVVPVRWTSSATPANETKPTTIAMLRRPTFTFTASAIRRGEANPWKGESHERIFEVVARIAPATRLPRSGDLRPRYQYGQNPADGLAGRASGAAGIRGAPDAPPGARLARRGGGGPARPRASDPPPRPRAAHPAPGLPPG